MNTAELKVANWNELRSRVDGIRLRVYNALAEHGPCTTRILAAHMGMDLLSVRPRVCELLQLGFVELTGRNGHEGEYTAVAMDTVRDRLEARRSEEQTLMKV